METSRERSRTPPTSLVVWRWCWKKTEDTQTWYWEWFPVTTAWIQSRANPTHLLSNTLEPTSVSAATTVSSSSSPKVASVCLPFSPFEATVWSDAEWLRSGGHTKYPWSSTWVELNFATREAYLFSVVFAWAPASVSQTPGLLHHFRSCVVMKCAVCLRSKQSLTLFLKN